MSSLAPHSAAVPQSCDLAIVGGGIVGLAVARDLLMRNPRASLCVLERESDVATHQTGHSSGVIHAGIYYRPGSLKARLCVQGARELFDYCDQRGIASEACGKVILATDASELHHLEELERRGKANGVSGLRQIDAARVAEIEPHARAIAALHSPHTGICDFPAVARSFAQDVREAGGTIATNCEVKDVEVRTRSLRLVHARGTLQAGHAIFCAGAWADRLAVAAGAGPDPRIVPFRGAYLRLVPGRRHLVRSLIYPVPDPSLPFLGVHLTRHIDGDVLIGPSALIAGARDAYRLASVRRADAIETLTWPGTWRMFGRLWPAGVTELRRALQRSALVGAAARYVPELSPQDVETSFSGVRAQALGRDGRLIDDFAFSVTERALHVRNAPSPAATASLAIARHVTDLAQPLFGLDH
ncbi:MAG: (S)-2-hydroxyglutarate dehydrogenase [Solirubrobacteraceae bacterium]|nr:(S)-2-hydroxyglutarate dehydrogenase [Solirubrobacteraceae bacterium]